MYQNCSFLFSFRLILFLSVILSSCNSNIDKEKFQKVILEIHKCEAWNEYKHKGVNKQFEVQCKESAMTQLNISKDELEDIMKYYENNPEEYEAIYDSVVNKIESNEYK